MFGFKFVKFQPSDYIIQVKNGKVVREGIGLSFYYYERATSVVVIPISSIDVPFMFEEMTRDYQTVTVQGQLTYRIVDYRKMMEIMNYTYNIKKKAYMSDDPVKLSQRIIQIAKVLTKKQLEQLPLKEAIQSSERLAKAITQEVSRHEELAKLGIELMGLSILAVLPNKETMRALEAQSREQMLQDADEALYVRRNASIEQERRVKENELNTDIAVELKKRQIREAQLDAERSVREKQNELKEVQLHFDTQLEEKKQAMIELAAANKRSEADARAYELAAVMKSLQDTQPYVLQAMANMGMDSNKLIAIAFQEMAEKAERIGQLNISPDLLQSLIPGAGNGAGSVKPEARGGERR
ncbi:membrane protease subunit, stomatin/prohibitin [Paenibacillus sp. BIHB 4019]|uniref:Membrane protease subunit, stomatin/prohibitin n=1 Tax=Paenibacillus sp. BIHB 4019 TaxID=1870819 RepID=A0A1B2DMN4_9BACL|nr:SPFH domain-containing protein [Paenibacillus sp. BIHB 4019]ANY68972.1 membrane protease subunit, stomatin/prohibitin [Paenibacillus sp. BIHB 4019]